MIDPMSADIAPPPRPLPMLTIDNRAFWTGGGNGRLLISRCQACEYLIHPPASFCPRCESRDVAPSAVSGKGTIVSMTVNHRAWVPGLPVPFVLAFVALEEQADVRLATNIVGCSPEDAHIGMPVRVVFERQEDVWLPFFTPDRP